MKTKILPLSVIWLVCWSFSAAAQETIKPPKNIQLAPDLQVKEVKAEWFTIAGRGSYLEVTPVIQKNKTDKITPKPGEPMIIFVGTVNQNVLKGPTCQIEVSSWTTEETEKSFGTCALKPEKNEIITSGVVVVDSGNRIKELNENNNVGNIKIPPKPAN